MSATPDLDNPLLAYLGVHLAEAEVGRAALELDIDARHLNRQRSLQGGVAATLLDAACGYAGLRGTDGSMGQAVTLMLSVSYLGKVSEGRVRATGRVTRAGRKIFFCDGELRAADGSLVATAQGTFKLTPTSGASANATHRLAEDDAS